MFEDELDKLENEVKPVDKRLLESRQEYGTKKVQEDLCDKE